jgi:hypothetical protein
VRSNVLVLLLIAAGGLCACQQYDPKLLEDEGSGSSTPAASGKDGGARDAGPGPTSDGATANAGSGGSGAAGGGDTGGGEAGTGPDGGLTGVGVDCVLNTEVTSLFCPYVCREICNELDDDCDEQIDEGGSDQLCPAANALAACIAGQCVIAECTEGYRDCDGDPLTGCEVAPEDPNHCGSCGRKCELLHAVATCVEGVCTRAACEPLYDDCDENRDDCETAVTTLDNCAMCSTSCSDVPNATPSCGEGYCGVGQCAIGFGDCNVTPGDGCEQTLDTLEHCGGCTAACDLLGSSDDCLAGVCLANTCDTGFDQCDGDRANGCESLDSTQNCSACSRRCDDTLDNVASASCSGGVCQPVCEPSYGDCDSDAFTGCETALDSEQHCLACGMVCEAPNAVMACGDSGCELVRCQPGWGDCNDNVALDGCETSLNQDATCGSCTRACAAPDPVCSGGTCSDVTCEAGLADCNQDGFPCEIDLRTDANNCAACGAKCEYTTPTPNAGAPTCVASACRANCNALRADCNRDYRDGCEQALTTLTSCGSCGVACSIANATATCTTGSCRVQTCGADFADCNGDGTSCETRLDTTQNCGACGRVCNLPGAVPSCAGSAGNHSCAISACNSAFLADCDGVAATGCEVDRRTAVAHCGACSNDCRSQPNVASATCSNSSCRPVCTAGFGDCDPALPGCETSLRTLGNCGGCGVSCSRPGGGESCDTGTCQLTECDPNFDDCDGNPNNGCEPLSTLAHCGACDRPCTIVNGDGDCGTGSCEVASCDSGWADCNDDPSDGCERNTSSPATGGQGPCLPDPSCTRFPFNGRDFYFCTADRTWSQARALCQAQLLGDLVHVDDATENTFVQSHLNNVDAWLGGSDAAAEGTWRWANDTARFWMGAAGGSGTGFTFWQSGEPNNSNDEDCAMMYATSARWNDAPCSSVHDFVCEVQPDLCPSDPEKANPLQCGCGNPETDSDNDGTANCNDLCPSDALKTAPGTCNCGVADTNTDGDAQPDCLDECDSDPTKTAVGACGCGMPDTNSDGDSLPDCRDECPLDAARVAMPCSFDYTPSNFDPTTLDFDGAPPPTNLDCQATITINTSANSDAVKENQVTFTNWCGTVPRPLVRTQPNGPEVVIIPLQGLTLAATRTLRLIGSRPVIFAVRGDVSVAGTVNARGLASQTGAGGNTSCGSAGRGGDGGNTGSNDGDSGGGGGGGGGFAGGGANGGTGDVVFSSNARGPAGAAAPAAAGSLVPLRGGCNGGKGGNGNGTGPSGGGGGGAVQIAASGTLSLAGSAIISASGGGGTAATHQEDGGAGGGSGGGVLLEAGVITIADNAWITANGGGGSSGASTNSVTSAAGADGAANNSTRAPRGAGNDGAGAGGEGSVTTGSGPGGGGDGQGTGFLGLARGAGGGGGGGGVGFIRVRGTRSCTPAADGNFSPPVTRTCP